MTTSRIIDTKLPLTWLLSTAGAIILALAGVAVSNATNTEKTQAKLDTLISSVQKVERRGDISDQRIDGMREAAYAQQRAIDAQGLRIEALERVTRK